MKNINTIAIIGLGLMGGSLAAACRKNFPHARILGISRNALALRQALKKKWIHESFTDLKQGVSKADLIILCAPVDVFPQIFRALKKHLKSGALITDVGSTKGQVSKWARLSGLQKHFIGAHPMVGSERRGLEAAQPNLYQKGLTFVVRDKATPAAAFQTVKAFWTKISGKVVEVSASDHDRVVAEISHLPHALAVALMHVVNPGFYKYAASGFHDTTRVAKGDPSIWLPIFKTNRVEVARTLDKLEKQIRTFRSLLIKNDQKRLGMLLGKAAQLRSEISLSNR